MRSYGAQSEVAPLRKVIIHVPSREEFTVLERESVAKWLYKERPNFDILLEEIEEVISCLKEEGIEVIIVRGGVSPNQIYVRDVGITTDIGFIAGSFRYAVREGEEIIVLDKLKELGIPVIKAPKEVALEGGDILFMDVDEVLVGIGDRTNEKGYLWITHVLKNHVSRVIPVRLNPEAFHLDLAFNLADKRVCAIYEPALPKSFKSMLESKGFDIIKIPKEDFRTFAINWLTLREGRILFYDGYNVNRKTRKELEKRGIDVISVDITEITKGNGGLRCITLPILREY
ncbi:MAG: hypothetical protein DRZ82_00300 [Thermoprotei archaeon]|nr:MAG: hypothetical protein DRZ82_00300 [Thermoprotei archaeon]